MLEQEFRAHKCDQLHRIRKWRKADLPRYEAISYAWGTDTKTESVIIDSGASQSTLRVRCNVAKMLRVLRYQTKPRCVWIDSICINQIDTREKENQVRQMGQIYADAVRVIVWLGLYRDRHGPTRQLGCRSCISRILQGEQSFCDTCLAQRTREVIRRDWFSRRWIIQEVALACEARILYGDGTSVDFQDFAKSTKAQLQLYDQPSSQKELTLADREVLKRLEALATLQSLNSLEFRAWEMRDLLLEFSAAQCSDGRDILYALNSLSINPVFVSYHEMHPVEHAFSEFARREATTNLAALLACAGAYPPKVGSDMPTWVPDWRTTRVYHPLSENCYQNCKESQKFFNNGNMGRVEIDDKNLCFDAYEVDSVRLVSLDRKPSAWGNFYADFRKLNMQEVNATELAQTLSAGFAFTSEDDQADLPLLLSRERSKEFLLQARIAQSQITSSLDRSDQPAFPKRIPQTMMGRTCFFTKSGAFGIGPQGIEDGDLIIRVPGRLIFLAIRPTERSFPATGSKRRAFHAAIDPSFADSVHGKTITTLIGECYVPELAYNPSIQHNINVILV
ncbi:heterokaryon incompatibility protein-domain-containing protein [Pyrenochaeta sp. MPI-SDFR-AT-0127]|nr:heterokaryon incompatibility protein-domain-containing protein [Pyrenochaeta sp. MPI-SDFR-AT-0127]